jgi:hypothetical protein
MVTPLDPAASVLWRLERDGKMAGCDVGFVPIGVQVRIFKNESLLMSRIFSTGEEGLAWAQEERERMIESGWVRVTPSLTKPLG